jgi:hypothetical protein
VDVLPQTGEVHVAHGPAFGCFLTLDLCDCCTCNNCKSRKTAIETWMDLVEEETGGAGPQALTRGRLSDLFVIAEALEALGHRGSAG